MGKFVRLAFVAPVIAIAILASSAVAFADNGVTLSVNPNVQLTDRVQVVVTLTYSCPSGWSSMGGSLTIEQPAGKQIASSQAYFSAQCNGADQTTTVTMLANPSGPPFHNGPAVVNAAFSACNYMAYPPTCGSANVNGAIKLQ
jgi:hypothetical protein